MLSHEEKVELLKIARESIRCFLEKSEIPRPITTFEKLKENLGAFVSLHIGKKLRGCIGTFFADRALFETVNEMATAAAFQDPRFPPLTPQEFDKLEIEISVLSPRREIKDINKIEIGKHGLYISQGFNNGVLLPQVATEYHWDKKTFLKHTCLKAGLSPDAWENGAKIEIFEAQVFNEKELSN